MLSDFIQYYKFATAYINAQSPSNNPYVCVYVYIYIYLCVWNSGLLCSVSAFFPKKESPLLLFCSNQSRKEPKLRSSDTTVMSQSGNQGLRSLVFSTMKILWRFPVHPVWVSFFFTLFLFIYFLIFLSNLNCGGGRHGYSNRERQKQSLPVYKYRTAILYLVEAHATTIIVGETGSGKTTQIPQV